MLLKSVKKQTQYIMHKWTFLLTWYIVCGFMVSNFIHNVAVNGNRRYVSQMFDITKIITLSDWTKSGYFFMIYYPLLVVLATSAVFLDDKNSRMQTYLMSRIGQKNYYISKTLSVFIATFLLFTVPFIMELLLEITCLHVSSNGDPSNFPYYQTIGDVKSYFCSGLYLKNKILYVFVMILLFGIVSGILAVFNFAISTCTFLSLRYLHWFPVYLFAFCI